MLQTDKYKTRKQKLSYLRGLLEGRNTVYEITDMGVFFFWESEEPGLYFRRYTEKLEPKEGDTRRYTVQEIEKIRKRPNTIVSYPSPGKHETKN